MLADADSYTEKNWQAKILELLLFVFPKYIAVLENVHIKDFYSNPNQVTNRYIDLMLVDANGSVDIIESKSHFRMRSYPYTDIGTTTPQGKNWPDR